MNVQLYVSIIHDWTILYGCIVDEWMILCGLADNSGNRYTEANKIIGMDVVGNRDRGEIVTDISTSFMVLLAIYFPSCTGGVICPDALRYC